MGIPIMGLWGFLCMGSMGLHIEFRIYGVSLWISCGVYWVGFLWGFRWESPLVFHMGDPYGDPWVGFPMGIPMWVPIMFPVGEP